MQSVMEECCPLLYCACCAKVGKDRSFSTLPGHNFSGAFLLRRRERSRDLQAQGLVGRSYWRGKKHRILWNEKATAFINYRPRSIGATWGQIRILDDPACHPVSTTSSPLAGESTVECQNLVVTVRVAAAKWFPLPPGDKTANSPKSWACCLIA